MGDTVTASPVLGGVITDLVDAATIAWALTGAFAYRVTIAASRVLGNPTNLIPGSLLTLEVVHGAISTDLTYGSVFQFEGGVRPTLSPYNGAIDFLTFFTDGTYMYLIASALDMGVPLVAPSGLTASNDEVGQVTLGWTNNAVGATGVVVERDDGVGFNQIAEVAANAVSYIDVITDGTYDYRVKAKRNATLSGASNVAPGTSLP